MAAKREPVRRSAFDRALGAVGLQRVPRSAAKTGAGKRSVYAAAQIGRMTQDWFASMLSADRAIKSDFRLLRERARQLGRDNPLVSRYRQLQSDGVVGHVGVRFQSTITLDDGETLDAVANQRVEDGWNKWCLPEYATVDGLLSMTEVARLAIERLKEDGEALIRMWPGFGNDFAFALQPLDADVLDHNLNRARSVANGVVTNEIRMGVERDRFGKPLAYWLYSGHPSDIDLSIQSLERVPVPASEIIHLYKIDRPGQTRGVTSYAPVMIAMNILGEYITATLTASRIGASAMFAYNEGDDEETDEDDPKEIDVPLEAEGGIGFKIPKGSELFTFDPKQPTQAFGDFVKNVQRWIAMGWNVAYSSLTGDLADANFGSQRQGMNAERDGYKFDQQMLITKLYMRVFRVWLKYAMTTGEVDLPIRQLKRYLRFGSQRWLPRGFPWIDPLKDVEASVLAINNRLDSRTNVCADRGDEFPEIIAQHEQEQELAEAAGVALPIAADTGASLLSAPASEQDGTSGGSNDDDDKAAGSGAADDQHDGSADAGARSDDSRGSAGTATRLSAATRRGRWRWWVVG